MRNPWFMLSNQALLAIVVILIVIALIALGVAFSGYGTVRTG